MPLTYYYALISPHAAHTSDPFGISRGPDFHRVSLLPGIHAISCVNPFRGRPILEFASRRIESKGGVSPPSALRSRTSPIRGMRLRRTHRCWRHRLWTIRSERLRGLGWRPQTPRVARVMGLGRPA